ncbi:MAG: GNAT family N-acetyltransferase [Ilumatobacteraceae bacterium]
MSTAAPSHPARARLGRWPHERDIAHLVLLDHQMVPSAQDVAGWIRTATNDGARVIRTGALFPGSTSAFLAAGFTTIDTLALLARPVEPHAPPHPRVDPAGRLRRLRPSMLHEAARIDERAFASTWTNDVAALTDIMSATPHHRSRSVHVDGRMVAFSISGRADQVGYIQRLAVDPSARRRGFARLLLHDADRWMRRRDVRRAMVNTASDNRNALALYESTGFEIQPGELVILERELRPA